LRNLDNAELARITVAEKLDLQPLADPHLFEVTLKLPDGDGGAYRVVVEVRDGTDVPLASASLELSANRLPKSLVVFCAHEDDETTQAAMIRSAIENNVPVRVVYFTSGDAGSCDRYFQRSCGPAEALHFGALRMDEARASLAHLGVPAENIFFLCLPDGGSGEIWYRHRESVQPYLSVLLASDHAPYEGLVRPNLPYARKSVIAVVKDLLRKFRPDAVVAAHPPSQGHIDHVVNGYFVIQALQELAREDPAWGDTKIFVDRVYDAAAAPRTPYRYQEHVLNVTGDVAARAQEATWFYQSQGGNRGLGRIRPYDQLPRAQTYRQVLDWTEHDGWNEED
jgi:LmbE family N-acetylglucosaminyl deacetylase